VSAPNYYDIIGEFHLKRSLTTAKIPIILKKSKKTHPRRPSNLKLFIYLPGEIPKNDDRIKENYQQITQ
jgi:hypothetical protein